MRSDWDMLDENWAALAISIVMGVVPEAAIAMVEDAVENYDVDRTDVRCPFSQPEVERICWERSCGRRWTDMTTDYGIADPSTIIKRLQRMGIDTSALWVKGRKGKAVWA